MYILRRRIERLEQSSIGLRSQHCRRNSNINLLRAGPQGKWPKIVKMGITKRPGKMGI